MDWQPFLLFSALPLLTLFDHGVCLGLPDPTGAPSGSCSALSPDPTQHGVPPNMSAVPYFLDFNFFRLEDGSFGYIPGNTYTSMLCVQCPLYIEYKV